MDDRQLDARDAATVAHTLERAHDADVAEALNVIDPPAAARVLAALPFDLAVRALNQPELDRRARLFEHLSTDKAATLLGAMSADQRTDLFRELPERTAARLLSAVDTDTRESLRALLSYPPTTAGGIMTTEHVVALATWTVERTLTQIRAVAQPRPPGYAVDVFDPADRRLVHVVTLRELVLADPTLTLLEVGDRRPPVTVTVWTDREEAARLIAKYDLLAVPVIDEGGHLLGIVTVDDVIDALVKEQTEDVHKLGGVQELDEPYTRIGRIAGWQVFGFYDYGPHWPLVALAVGLALVGVVTFGSLAGSMLPFVLRRVGFDPASASAPFVATLVDVSGLVIYFTVAYVVLHGTL